MLIVLLIGNFILALFIFYNSRNDYGPITAFRMAYLKACILIVLTIFTLTEFLSFFDGITYLYMILSWSSIMVILATILWVRQRNSILIGIRSLKSELSSTLKKIEPSYRRLINVTIVFVILPLLFLAVYVPPNTWDAMTYHLSRVEHWIQNKNVEYYPTPNIRQLFHQPLELSVLRFEGL